MLDSILLILLVGALAPYVLGPVLVRLSQRWPARAAFVPYDPIRHPLPDQLAASFRETVDALVADGLQLVADLAHASPITKIQLRVALLHDPASGDYAMVVAARSTNPQAKIAACFAEFAMKFTDGTTMSVTNSLQPRPFGDAPGRRIYGFQRVRDPARLRRVYRALLARDYGGRPRQPLDLADPGRLLSEAMTRDYSVQVETGYLRLDDGAQEFRPTWLGAWAMTYRLLSPFRQIREARQRRRAAALLRELGLAGPDPRPIASPPSPDATRWNFALLVVVAVIYVLSRPGAGGGLGRVREGPVAKVRVPADFTVPAEFPSAVRALEQLVGETAVPLEGIDSVGEVQPTPGFTVGVSGKASKTLLDDLQGKFLSRGFYLFVSERGFGSGPDRLALFPRSDPYEILRLMGTNGWNYDIGPDSVVAWLRALAREQPFVITGIGFDWVEGQFSSEIRDVEALARRFNAFCPDIVEQGTGSVGALARELRTTRTLYCWWD
jgi:hypothetical protein